MERRETPAFSGHPNTKQNQSLKRKRHGYRARCQWWQWSSCKDLLYSEGAEPRRWRSGLPGGRRQVCVEWDGSLERWFQVTPVMEPRPRRQLEEPKVRDFVDSQVPVRPCVLCLVADPAQRRGRHRTPYKPPLRWINRLYALTQKCRRVY